MRASDRAICMGMVGGKNKRMNLYQMFCHVVEPDYYDNSTTTTALQYYYYCYTVLVLLLYSM